MRNNTQLQMMNFNVVTVFSPTERQRLKELFQQDRRHQAIMKRVENQVTSGSYVYQHHRNYLHGKTRPSSYQSKVMVTRKNDMEVISIEPVTKVKSYTDVSTDTGVSPLPGDDLIK
jgi:hypothetical protein